MQSFIQGAQNSEFHRVLVEKFSEAKFMDDPPTEEELRFLAQEYSRLMVARPKPARRFNNQSESSRPPVAPTAPSFEDKAQAPQQPFQPFQPRERAQDVCHGCKKPGHWVRDCPEKPSAKVGVVEDETLLEGEKLKFCTVSRSF